MKRTFAAVPETAPPLTALTALKDKLEADRAEIFPKWKSALEATQGNVTRAAALIDVTRDRFNRLMRRFALTEYATQLRYKAGGAVVVDGENRGKVMGRPKKVTPAGR